MNAGNQLDYILLGPYIDADANINTNMSPESCLSVFSLETITPACLTHTPTTRHQWRYHGESNKSVITHVLNSHTLSLGHPKYLPQHIGGPWFA